MKKIKVFVDSNVWFSVFYKKGVASDLINKFLQEEFEVIISELVLEEIIRNIEKKVPGALSLVYRFFQEYPIAIVRNPDTKEQLQKFIGLAQKKDLPILISALNYKCNFFVTGNKRDFKTFLIKKRYHLLVLNPREMLNRLGKVTPV